MPDQPSADTQPLATLGSAPPEAPGSWHRAATTLGPVTLQVVYHAASTDAIFELAPNLGDGPRLLEGTGNLAAGIEARAEAGTGTIRLRLSLDQEQQPSYVYELTSAATGQLRCAEGTLARQ